MNDAVTAGEKALAGNPLLSDLEPAQLDLLDCVWLSMYNASMAGKTEVWPIWDALSRTFWNMHSDLDPAEILAALPTIVRQPGIYGDPYGLLWRSEHQTTSPVDTERIGLTISGFLQLAINNRRNLNVPDAFAAIIRTVAEETLNLPMQPDEPASAQVDLSRYAGFLTSHNQQKPFFIPVEAVGQILQKEYAPINLSPSNGVWKVSLSGSALRPYVKFATAREYVDLIVRQSQSHRSITRQSITHHQEAPMPEKKTIFIVHGHDDSTKNEVARFIEQNTRNTVTVLHEQANRGQTIIEKFEAHAQNAACAIILLTPDDVGGKIGAKEIQPRARQNVVFEFGYFAGLLGRRNVIALTTGDVEQPSDLSGVLYQPMKGNWQHGLLQELRYIDGIEIS